MSRKLNRSRVALSIAMASALAMVAVGCSSSSNDEGDNDGSASIKWWSFNPNVADADIAIAAFNEEYPDIEVEYRLIGAGDYTSTILPALQSGSGPDVFGTRVGAFSEQFAPFMEDVAPVAAEALGDDWEDQFTGEEQLNVEGKFVALPYFIAGAPEMWANQTLIDGLGLTVPQTWDELLEFCAAVKAGGFNCIEHGGQDAWINIETYQGIMNQVSPAAFYPAVRGEEPFDAPEFQEGFAIFKSLFDEGVFQEGALGATHYPDANDAFVQGKAALQLNGTWNNLATTNTGRDNSIEAHGDAFDPETIFVPYFMPAFVDGADNTRLHGGPDLGYAVAVSSKEKEAANTFLLWLTSGGGQELQAASGKQPAFNAVPLDYSDVIDERQVEALEEHSAQLTNLIGQRQVPRADVDAALGEALSAVAAGVQTPEEAAAAVQAVIDSGE